MDHNFKSLRRAVLPEPFEWVGALCILVTLWSVSALGGIALTFPLGMALATPWLVATLVFRHHLEHSRTSLLNRIAALQQENIEFGVALRTSQSMLGDQEHKSRYLSMASARFEELFHGVPFACFTVDREGTIFEWNEAASALFEVPAHHVILKAIGEDLFSKGDSAKLKEAVHSALNGKNTIELAIDCVSSTTRKNLLVNVFAVGTPEIATAVLIACADVTNLVRAEQTISEQNDRLREAMVKISDNAVTLDLQKMELEEANEKLRLASITDGITGLLNHRAMQDELADALSRSQNSGAKVGVVLLDVDHFKKFNDDFGHQTGDEVLRSLAEILKLSVRETDIVARYGGEEFCVVLPGTDEYECKLVCENIRQNVERATWPKRKVTISVGYTVANGDSAQADLISMADQALYKAKGAGRNRVCMYEPPMDLCA